MKLQTWQRTLFLAALCFASTRSADACLWDRDTLVDEQRGLPEITDYRYALRTSLARIW